MLSEEEIKIKVTDYIRQSQNGATKENDKFDFKQEWYDLSTDQGKSEFIKDTSSIANTFGPDGLIVIGFNDKTNTYHPAYFKDSRLRDVSELNKLINSKVKDGYDVIVHDFEVEGKPLSILQIPPSLSKPHVITLHRNEQNRIFVRKGTSTWPASKQDLELMFYDRKNIVPEYEIHCTYSVPSINATINDELAFKFYLHVENSGRRPVAIKRIR